MGVVITTSSAPMVMVMVTVINAVKITAVAESGRKIEILTAIPVMVTHPAIKRAAVKVSNYSMIDRMRSLTCPKNFKDHSLN